MCIRDSSEAFRLQGIFPKIYVTSVLAGFAFSTFSFAGKNIFFMLMLATMMIPFEVILIPNFLIINTLGQVLILPKHVWGDVVEKTGIAKPQDFRNMPLVGSGAYTLRYWREGQEISLQRRADHFAKPASDLLIVVFGSAERVGLAEAKLRGALPDAGQMRAIMAGLYSQPDGNRIDQLVLACTHFPLLANEIAAAGPPGVILVDSGEGIARRTEFLTHGQEWAAEPRGIAVFTKDSPDLGQLRPALAKYGMGEIQIL